MKRSLSFDIRDPERDSIESGLGYIIYQQQQPSSLGHPWYRNTFDPLSSIFLRRDDSIDARHARYAFICSLTAGGSSGGDRDIERDGPAVRRTSPLAFTTRPQSFC